MGNHKGFTLIEIFILVAIIVCCFALYFSVKAEESKKKDFLVYCESKGRSAEDCKWEWERMKRGEPSTIVMPLFIPMGR